MEVRNPELKITTTDFGLLGNIAAMQYDSYQVVKGWFGMNKTVRGSGFLETTFQKLIFANNKVVSEDGEDFRDPFRRDYLYDENSNLAEIKLFAEHPYTKEIREYDTTIFNYISERELEQKNYVGHDRNYSRIVFTLSDKVIEGMRYDESGNTTDKDEFAFDEKNILLSKTEYKIYRTHNPASDSFAVMDFSHRFYLRGETDPGEEPIDSEEQLYIDKEYSDGEEYLTFKTVYVYDENEFLIEEIYYSDDSEQFKLIYHNDNLGNPILIINYEDEEVVDFQKFEYKYDGHGNWTVRKEFEVEEWNKNNFMQNKAALKYIVKRKFNYI